MEAKETKIVPVRTISILAPLLSNLPKFPHNKLLTALPLVTLYANLVKITIIIYVMNVYMMNIEKWFRDSVAVNKAITLVYNKVLNALNASNKNFNANSVKIITICGANKKY